MKRGTSERDLKYMTVWLSRVVLLVSWCIPTPGTFRFSSSDGPSRIHWEGPTLGVTTKTYIVSFGFDPSLLNLYDRNTLLVRFIKTKTLSQMYLLKLKGFICYMWYLVNLELLLFYKTDFTLSCKRKLFFCYIYGNST